MSSGKIRLSFPSPVLVGSPLIHWFFSRCSGTGVAMGHSISTSLHPWILESSCPTESLPKPDKEKSGEEDLGGERQTPKSSGSCQGGESLEGVIRRRQRVSLHTQISKSKQNYISVYAESQPKSKTEMTKLTRK